MMTKQSLLELIAKGTRCRVEIREPSNFGRLWSVWLTSETQFDAKFHSDFRRLLAHARSGPKAVQSCAKFKRWLEQ